ncbi:hypothetical protein B0I37DRAFT_341873 [Chaetomium sp. MPI-CAGE-AT-0009]|nr:hypothetical protein B0I37DRAFT_341873 [Chaetomium sp. MPI-CAGE-AT-0009]
MLNDQEIERAAAQLADYKRSDALSKLLDQYSVLIDDYKRLKSDYEEERETREKYKQMAKDQERNPFVLVLVDGDGYVFNDTFLSQRAEGGGPAAQALNDEVKASLRRKGLEHCQVMVRIYANVFGLSKALSKTGVVGADCRSLAPFIAGFNRSYGLSEFVDAGQLKENADFKIRAMLRLYADNSQCKHIYFAACHDVGYISELTPFMGNSSKFTLINTPGVRFHNEFTKLGMGIEEFRAAFRHSPLDGFTAYRPVNGGVGTAGKPAIGPPQPASPSKVSASPAMHDMSKILCPFHSIGKCRSGKSCKMLHDGPSNDTRSPLHSSDMPSPSSPASTTHDTAAVASQLASLPRAYAIPEGQVMVNENNYRLDPYLPAISADVISRLKARVDKRRLCNNFHLQGICDAGDRCEYDHEPLDPETLPALLSLARSQPCPRRGGCRLDSCYHGHICQNLGCKHRGGKVYCKLPYLSHLEPLSGVRYLPAVSKQSRKTNGGSASSTASR